MKKILAIIGSPNGSKSNTRTMTLDFLEMVKTYNPDVEYEIMMLEGKNLHFCKGCWGCTKTGLCVIKDDLQEIQEKMLASDLLIFGSPVYVQHISAQMKVLFDRIYVWLHTVKLIGKPAITAITTAYSGRRPTEKYLDDMMTCMGTIIVGHLRGLAYTPGHFPKREHYREKHRKLAKKAVAILNGQQSLKPSLKNAWFFYGMKQKAKYGKSELPYEYSYWQEKGWFRLSYKQALRQELAGQELC
jgi:multimeric flavodoxin WrbA